MEELKPEEAIKNALLAQKLLEWNRGLSKPVIIDSCEYSVAFKMLELIRLEPESE